MCGGGGRWFLFWDGVICACVRVCVSRPHTHNEPSLHTQVPAHGHAPAACLQLAPGVLLLINQELAKHAVDAPGPLLRVRSVVARDHVAWGEEWFLVQNGASSAGAHEPAATNKLTGTLIDRLRSCRTWQTQA